MFKRFLKFFRGEHDSPEEPFEGSYLDHLLAQITPAAEQQIEECPQHDPLLLVVVGLLRHTMINAWSPKLRCPLTDSQSPGSRTPVEPLPPEELENPAPESDTTNEFDAVTPEVDATDDKASTSAPAPGLDEQTSEPAADSQLDADDEHDEEAPPESDADAEPDGLTEETDAEEQAELDGDESEESGPHEDSEPDEDALTPRSTRKTEEIDVEEVRRASMRRAAEEESLTETMEMDRTILEPDPTIEIEQDAIFEAQGIGDGRPRVDSEEVLQAGRVFLGLLIENDRLPLDLQLSVAETTLARDLLLGYFVGHDDFDDKARRLLALVEQKFGEGLFSQARILLQLFHTDEQTRINNDRNLFYEDMILRLGIRRRHRMSDEELQRFEALLKDVHSPSGASAVIDWLSTKCLIKFHAFNRDPQQVDEWSETLENVDREGARENFLRYLPARRWRPFGHFEGLTPVDQMRRHVSMDTAREYVIAQLKTCYFVLRAVGDTGLEGYLDTFFDWASDEFGVNGTRLMPQLYKRSMMDPEPMEEILRELYDEHFAGPVEQQLDSWTDADIEAALYEALSTMGGCDLGEIAPGYYDLGSFVYDQLFRVSYPSDEFPFKIHRLT